MAAVASPRHEPLPATASPDSSLRDLSQLLQRLSDRILTPKGAAELQKSPLQRTKNIEHARSLVLRLEHDARSPANAEARQGVKAALREKRALLKTLQDRLFELGQADAAADDSGGSDDDTAELLARYAPARPNVQHGINTDREADAAAQTAAQAAAASLQSVLRSRKRQDAANDTGATTGRAHGAQPQASTPFPQRRQGLSDGDTLMGHHSSEQEVISASLLALASQLKSSTMSFSDTLKAADPLVDKTGAALDKNVSGMQAAEKRMGLLRRMTEGKGWWARLSLYAWVGVLWVVLILVMFVMPKLRF